MTNGKWQMADGECRADLTFAICHLRSAPGGRYHALMSKALLRDRLLRERRAVTPAEHTARSAAVVARVIAMTGFAQASHVAAYLPLLGEVDVLPVLSQAALLGKRVYLPRLLDGGRLEFAAYDASMVVKGPRGVMQPAPELPGVPVSEIDFMLVPGLGFDRAKYRLGMGAGYYDKTLAGQARRPFCVGVGFDFQLVDSLPADSWDVPLDAVALEKATIL